MRLKKTKKKALKGFKIPIRPVRSSWKVVAYDKRPKRKNKLDPEEEEKDNG